MAEVTGIIGSEQVELNNAATEETLKALLASIKTLNKSVLNISSGGGSNAAATRDAADAINDLGDGLKKVNPIIGAVSTAFGGIIKLIGGLGNVVGVAAGEFVNLGINAIKGTATMSTFYESVGKVASSIPIFGSLLGPVIGFFTGLIKLQEATFASYQQLTNVGINFGGDLTKLRASALKMNLTLDELTEVMVTNGAVISKMGLSVNDGAMAFAKLNENLISGNLGRNLQALGFTSKEVSNGLATFLAATSTNTAVDLKDQKKLSASAAEYMTQLDALAEITGKTKEEQLNAAKDRAANVAWEAHLMTLSAGERVKAEAAAQEAFARGGKGAQEAVMSAAMGFPPMTKAAQEYTAIAGNMNAVSMKQVDAIYDATKSVEDMRNGATAYNEASVKDKENLGISGRAIIMQGTSLATTAGAVIGTANRIQKQGADSASKAESQLDAVRKTQQERMISQANAVSNANRAMKDFGEKIMAFIGPIMSALTGPMGEVIEKFTAFVSEDKLKALGEQFGKVITDVAEWLKNVFSPEGQDKMLNDLKYMFGLIGIEIKKALLPDIMYSDRDAKLDTIKLDNEKKLYDARATAAKSGNVSDIKLIEDRIKKNKDSDKTISGWGGAAAGAASLGTTGAALGLIGGPLGAAIFGAVGAAMGGIAGSLGMIDYGINTPTPLEGYDTGTLGKTGKLFKDFGKGTQVTLHGTESVSTPEQMADLVSKAVAASQSESSPDTNNLVGEIQRLNTLTAEMLRHIKDTAENTKRTVEATRSLSGNLF